jgi:hypothetical protein
MQRSKVAILGAGVIMIFILNAIIVFIPEAEVVAVYTRKAEKA